MTVRVAGSTTTRVTGQRPDIGTYVLVVLDTQNAGYGASSTVPEAQILCDEQ